MVRPRNKSVKKTKRTINTPTKTRAITDNPPENLQHQDEQQEPIITTHLDLSMDISTSILGLCALERTTGALIHLSSIKLNSTQFKDMWQKADEVRRYIKELINPLSDVLPQPFVVDRVFVEANAKMFNPKFSSIDTLMCLAKFNAICSFIAREELNTQIIDINVVSARAKLGIKVNPKDKSLTTKEKVRNIVIKQFPLPLTTHVAKTGNHKGQIVYDKECEDQVDAFVIARGGQLMFP